MPITRKIELLESLKANGEMFELGQQLLKSLKEFRAKPGSWDSKMESQHNHDLMETAMILVAANNWTLSQSMDYLEHRLFPAQLQNIYEEKQLLERKLSQLLDQEREDLERWMASPQEEPSDTEDWPCKTPIGSKPAPSASTTSEDQKDNENEENEEEDSHADNPFGNSRKDGNGDGGNGDNSGSGSGNASQGGKYDGSGDGNPDHHDSNNVDENTDSPGNICDQGNSEEPTEYSASEINLHEIFYPSPAPSSLDMAMAAYADAAPMLLFKLSFPGSPVPYHDYAA